MSSSLHIHDTEKVTIERVKNYGTSWIELIATDKNGEELEITFFGIDKLTEVEE